jgi:hypothetical protein
MSDIAKGDEDKYLFFQKIEKPHQGKPIVESTSVTDTFTRYRKCLGKHVV